MLDQFKYHEVLTHSHDSIWGSSCAFFDKMYNWLGSLFNIYK